MSIKSPIPAAIAPGRSRWRGDWAPLLLALGWLIFLSAFFLAPDKHSLRTVFYGWVLLPALIGLPTLLRGIDGRDPLWIALLLAMLYLAASSFWGIDMRAGHPFTAIKVVFCLLALFLVPRFLAARGLLCWLVVSVLLLALAALAALQSLMVNLPAVIAAAAEFSQTEPPRLSGTGQYRNPLVLAGTMGCCGLLALNHLYTTQQRWHWLLLLALTILLALTMLLTMSRGPFLYFTAVTALIAISQRRYWRRTAVMALAFTFVILLPLLLSPELQSFTGVHTARLIYRPQIWLAVLDETRNHQLFGVGWRRDETVPTAAGLMGHSHNFLMGAYRFGGIVGLTLFIALVATLIWRATQLRRELALPLCSWLLFGIGLQLSNGRFPLSPPSSDWFFFWLPAALIFAFDQPGFHRLRGQHR